MRTLTLMGDDLRTHRIETNGIHLHVVESGPADGPAVVCCHGFPESWWSWRYQIDPLVKAGFRVVAPNQRGYGNLRSAEVAYQAALALDPEYADAWAGLAQTYALLPIYVWSGDPGAHESTDTYALAFDAAEHALRLDPKSSAALTARGSLREITRFDWAGTEADYRAAIAANPRDSTAHQWLGEMFTNERRWKEAQEQFDAALAIDPLSAVIHFAKAMSLALQGQLEASLPLFDKALALAPGFLEPLNMKTSVLIDLGRYDEAAGVAASLPETKRDENLKIIAALRDPSRKPEAVKFVLEHGGDGVILKPAQLARLGEYELAMTELQRLFAAKAPFRDYLYVLPRFEPLRKDPRFQALLKEIGLPLAANQPALPATDTPH